MALDFPEKIPGKGFKKKGSLDEGEIKQGAIPEGKDKQMNEPKEGHGHPIVEMGHFKLPG
jgi:hypothetical protein